MKRYKKNLMAMTAVLALTTVGQAAFHHYRQSPVTTSTTGAFSPKTIDELRSQATVIVLGEIVSVRRGDDIVTSQAKEPDGVDRIPTQRVTVRVIQPYKGPVAPGQELTLFRTGGAVLPPVPRAGTSASVPQHGLDGDPPYQPGSQHLLMLEGGPQSTLRPVSSEGRYQHDPRSDRLTATVDNPLARQIASTRLLDLEPSLRA